MLEFLVGVVVGAGVLYLFAAWILRRLISQAMSEDAVTAAREEDLIIRASVEEHNGVFYFYNEKNNEFLVQGSNLQELLEHLESRRPGTTVQVVNGDKETIAHLKSLAK
jgi:hypothetical protein